MNTEYIEFIVGLQSASNVFDITIPNAVFFSIIC